MSDARVNGPLARVLNYRAGPNGIELMLRLGPNVKKEKLESWLGEEGALLQLHHAPEAVQLKNPKNQSDKPKGGNLARLAGQWCKEKQFHEFLWDKRYLQHISSNPATAESDATKAIYRECGVKSRAELDHNPEAAKRFKELFIRPYGEYLKKC